MFKKVFLIISILCLSLSLFSCKKDNNEVIDENYGEVIIKTYDNLSNEITQRFTSKPQRVICNNLSSAKTMIDLGLKEYIIGMPNPDNEVEDKYKEDIDSILKLGDKKNLSKEYIISLNPDIIIGRAQMFSSTSFGTVEELNSFGIKVYTQSSSINNSKLDNVLDDIRNLGKIFDVAEAANSLAIKLSNQINQYKVNTTDYKKALVMCNFNNVTFGAYKSSLQEDLLNHLGYTNIATGTSGLTLENLVSMDPSLIIYVTSDRNKEADSNAIDNLLSNEVLSNVDAIRNNMIISITYDEFMEYGSNVIDSLERIYNYING
ncbi:MAG: ABC transporter substrate-binding protein [Anaeroplasmataceae bacterium]